ncbi:hypothetical protein CBR_g46405 [Chara braunii]|uniref:Myb-like domain-containing protein n=1 Tax=Chara braunii TaxID=69332 RepID=A0A388M0D3_CHABU|nr:hypothetical protein CBR_g46405 [Chara braunii]|eukprot:GBG88034.1 hypothetical protein CBR_g46405 [Chara braunii]
MADALHRVPLLLLTTLLLLLVVLLRVCVVVRGPQSRRKRRTSRKATMERRETSNGLHMRAIDFSTPDLAVAARRTPAYDLTSYSHLPPHEQPLPPDPEEEWLEDLSHTLLLGSGSTQDWMGSHCRQREAERSRQSFSAMLEEGADGGDTEIVDLDFGLSSGVAAPVTNNCALSHVAATTVGQTSVHGAGPREWWGVAEGRVRWRRWVAAQTGVAPAGDKGGKHRTWSVVEMVKLDRAKRDQQAHFVGMPHNYGRMRNREWKLQDLQKRLVEVDVKRTTDDIGKKWDNLFQQYKKIDNMSRGNKTIYPDNVADASACGEAQMPGDMQRPPSITGESIAGVDAGDGNDEDGGSARESGFSAGSTGDAGKRKNMRQQTFNTIAEVMEKHGALMADTVEGARKRQCSILERQCDILEREVDAQKRHYDASDEANRMMCAALWRSRRPSGTGPDAASALRVIVMSMHALTLHPSLVSRQSAALMAKSPHVFL